MLEVTDVTTVTVGLVRSVKVVAVPGGVRAPLSAEGGAGSDVPSALSTPPFSCRKRFLLNLARAFWNQTCKPIPIDFFIDFFLSFFSRSLPFFSFSFPLFLLLNIIFLGKKVDFFYFFQNRLLRVIDSSYFLFTVHIAALNVPLRITGIGAGKPQKQRQGD